MLKICITGGAGFIGHHTVRMLLAANHEIMVIDNLSVGKAENLPGEVRLIVADIFSKEAEQAIYDFKPEVVLHLAAMVTIRGSVDNFSEDARQNFIGTANVLEYSIKSGVKRFILASSMAVYDDSPTSLPLPETWTKKPLSPYGISKYAAEQLVHVMGKQAGMQTMVLRLFNTFGTGQVLTPYVGVITIFIDKILSEKPPVIFGSGEQCRDFVYVEDVSRAFLLAAESDETGISLNIGTGKGSTVNEVASLLLSNMDSTMVPEYGPERKEENKNSVADISLAIKTLGYNPKYSLGQKITEVIEFRKAATV